MACLGLVSWGLVGVFQKMSVDRVDVRTAFVWAAAGFMLLQVAVMPAVAGLHYSSKSLLCAVVNGICNGLGILFLLAAMRNGGKASIVESLAALYPLFVVMLSPTLLRERLSGIHLVGIGCAVLAAVLLSVESPAPSQRVPGSMKV
jgi:uncharacterized membrane protein